jgi:hypothetical protein
VRREDRGVVFAFALLALGLAGCATAQRPAGPPRLTVHVDNVDPAKLQDFIDARLKWVSHLKERGASDLRGHYFLVGNHTFYSLVPFADFRELAARGALVERRMRHVDQRAGDEYDRVCDGALIFPHKSEIWAPVPALDYAPPAPLTLTLTTAGYAELVLEDVKPTAQESYERAWGEMRQALAKVAYPLTRVTYFSRYGTGRMLSFWLAPSEGALRAAPTLPQALAAALGPLRAGELIQKWRDAVVQTETESVMPQPAMASPE